MGLFDFLKKNDDSTPPDVGKEEPVSEVIDEPSVEEEEAVEEEEEEKPIKKGKKGKQTKASASKSSRGSVTSVESDLELQKVQARVEALNSLIKGFSERFTNINQTLGELRAMNLSNEKSIAKVGADSAKAVSSVEEVKPEKLRFDVQKIEMKVEELNQKIESNRSFMDNLMEEVKDLRRKTGTFIGTEALLKLNEDVKKDLLNIEQVVSKTKMHADKSEQMFIEFNRTIAQNQKLSSSVNATETNLSNLRKDFEKIKIDSNNLANKNDIAELKKYLDGKVESIDYATSQVEKMGKEKENVEKLVEMAISLSKQNKEDIENIGLTLGNDHIQKVNEYDRKLNELLKIIDTLSAQFAELKKKHSHGSSASDSHQKIRKSLVKLKAPEKKHKKLKISDLKSKKVKKIKK